MVIERNIKRVKRPRISSNNTQTTSPGVLVKKVKSVVHPKERPKERPLYKKRFPKDGIWMEIAGMFRYYGKVSVL
jgi:hypothetical protein